jgi:hypothetical protein
VTIPGLAAIVRAARLEELPALAARCREAELLAEMRLRSFVPTIESGREPVPELQTGISPEAAAVIAGVPKEHIYSLG